MLCILVIGCFDNRNNYYWIVHVVIHGQYGGMFWHKVSIDLYNYLITG